MKFSTGQIVVHPHHGPATVKKSVSRTLRGERKRYLTLHTHRDQMTISIPEDLAEEMGVRPLLDADGVRAIFAILAGDSTTFDKVWSRRFKDYTERLNSGTVEVIAGLVRDITRRNENSRVSYGEMNVMREGRGPLISELALSLKLDEEITAELLEEAIKEGVVPERVMGFAVAS